MTQPALSVVTNTSALPSPSVDQTGPTPAEKLIIKEYVKDLKSRQFCKIDIASSQHTQVFDRAENETRSLSFIENDFYRWLHENSKDCSYSSPKYIIRTLKHVVGFKFIPNGSEYYKSPISRCNYVNTYRRYVPTTDSADVSPLFLEIFKRLAPSDYERHVLVQWLAHMFQHPEQRPSWHVLMPSVTGAGKGYLVEKILHPLLHHTQIVRTYSTLTKQFSTTLAETLLVLLDDCKSKSEATQTQLKSILSEERAYVERKNLAGGMENTYTRFILASNEEIPLPLDEDERRWFVMARLTHREDIAETQDFIGRLDAWLSLPGSLCKVYNYFMAYPLGVFNHKLVPRSDGLAALIGRSKGIHAEVLEAFIVDHPVFTTAELMQAYDEQSLARPPTKQIPALLGSVGYENKVKPVNGSRQHICYPIGMDLESIRAAYPPPDF